ncbi:MAG TPA: HIT domain-containing protein [Candidatus Paceibacterota bacterium]|nr:HIT domain-containing protein [Candidatus Paceibacterota bacterium]
MEEFEKYKLKDYKYWTIFIHQNQGYLGRCVIWCKRENALDLPDATPEEQKELFAVLNELRGAVQKAFQPDWLNYSFLGNETRHLHCHFVPRYANPKTFEGTIFKDELYGHNYKTDHSFSVSAEVVEKIRLRIKEALNKA